MNAGSMLAVLESIGLSPLVDADDDHGAVAITRGINLLVETRSDDDHIKVTVRKWDTDTGWQLADTMTCPADDPDQLASTVLPTDRHGRRDAHGADRHPPAPPLLAGTIGTQLQVSGVWGGEFDPDHARARHQREFGIVALVLLAGGLWAAVPRASGRAGVRGGRRAGRVVAGFDGT